MSAVAGSRRVALVHDYLLVMRGAERSFRALCSGWRDATLFTTVIDRDRVGSQFEGRRIETSPLQRLHVGQRGFRSLLPLYPWAVGRLDLAGYDLVISSSSAFAHGVSADPGAVHVCYCHSPFRYAWHERDRALAEAPAPLRFLLDSVLDRVREWDLRASSRVSRYVANSEITRERIERTYGREAAVVHPPVELERFRIDEPDDYLLVVSELVAHKRVDLALEAAALAGRTAVVVGSGPEEARLRARFQHGVEFRGRVPDAELSDLYARAGALLVPNVEEFGIAAVEAQASGRPVVGVAAGGLLETVRDGVTGALVERDEAALLAEAALALERNPLDPLDCRRQAERFSIESFLARIEREVALATS